MNNNFNENINNKFDKIEKIGHDIINILFIIALVIMTLFSKSFIEAILFITIIFLFLYFYFKNKEKYIKLKQIFLYSFLVLLLIDIILLYICK